MSNSPEEREFPKKGEEFIKPHRHKGIDSPDPNELAKIVNTPKEGIRRPIPMKPTPREGGKSRKSRKCKNDTYVWLNLWFKSEFEKLGWIILAKNKGDHSKVDAYKNSVKQLYNQLDCKIKDTKDHDRKQDLMIMLKDVKYLLVHIHKDF